MASATEAPVRAVTNEQKKEITKPAEFHGPKWHKMVMKYIPDNLFRRQFRLSLL
jgi:hypothetical protein